MADVAGSRARYRRILRFAWRYMAQAWWYELILPRIGLSRFAARGRAARLTGIARNFHTLALSLGGLSLRQAQSSARME